MTIRETLTAELDSLKAQVAAKEAALNDLEQNAGTLLNSEIETVKGWFQSLAKHLGL